MVASFSLLDYCYWCSSKQIERKAKHRTTNESQTRSPSMAASQEVLLCRRLTLLCSSLSLVSLSSSPIKAEEKKEKEDEGDNGIIGGITSLFNPNEKTKTGKVLPKSYVKAAREVVKTLRESLEEDAKDVAKFRRAADAAKVAIREYLNGWQGQKDVATEESYAALEKAIRSLANFYSKAGPFAPLSDENATSKLAADKEVTREDAEGVVGAEMRNRADLKTVAGGVADSLTAAAQINETMKNV